LRKIREICFVIVKHYRTCETRERERYFFGIITLPTASGKEKHVQVRHIDVSNVWTMYDVHASMTEEHGIVDTGAWDCKHEHVDKGAWDRKHELRNTEPMRL
jgi:hypothetical protein